MSGEDAAIRSYTEAFGPEVTAQLHSLAHEIAEARGAIILYDEMATLEPGCTDLAADLQALAVVTANIGRPGAGVGPLFEDANSLGARDMGLLPDALPGYMPVTEAGLTYSEMLSSPQIKALYVMGANPARHLDSQKMPELEFLIVQDILLTETAKQADVVLPAVTFAEKDGSMTNLDHHVQAIRRALRPLPGAKTDWEILLEIGKHMGRKWSYTSPQERDRHSCSLDGLCLYDADRAARSCQDARTPGAKPRWTFWSLSASGRRRQNGFQRANCTNPGQESDVPDCAGYFGRGRAVCFRCCAHW